MRMTSNFRVRGKALFLAPFFLLFFSASSLAFSITDVACQTSGYQEYKRGLLRELSSPNGDSALIFKVAPSDFRKDDLRGQEVSTVARAMALGGFVTKIEKTRPAPGPGYGISVEGLQSARLSCGKESFFVYWVQSSRIKWELRKEGDGTVGTLQEVRRIMDGQAPLGSGQPFAPSQTSRPSSGQVPIFTDSQ